MAAQGAVRRIADNRTPGYPCRISLTDAREGDELLLVNYEHHPVHSPYRMSYAIYVRKGEETYDADIVDLLTITRWRELRGAGHRANDH